MNKKHDKDCSVTALTIQMSTNEDFLQEDPAIRGQNYVCMSFLSPEDVIMRKDTFMFSKFLASFARDVTDMFEGLGTHFEGDKVVQDMLKMVRERYDYVMNPKDLDQQFSYWRSQNSDALDTEFNEQNGFQTSVRGIKVRGSYETFAEAENRCKQIKRFDPLFDVYVAQVGCWCPWAPRPELIPNNEFAEEQLNTMMKKYTEAQQAKNEVYQQRVQDMAARARPSSSEPMSKEDNEACENARSTMDQMSEGPDPWLAMRGCKA